MNLRAKPSRGSLTRSAVRVHHLVGATNRIVFGFALFLKQFAFVERATHLRIIRILGSVALEAARNRENSSAVVLFGSIAFEGHAMRLYGDTQ